MDRCIQDQMLGRLVSHQGSGIRGSDQTYLFVGNMKEGSMVETPDIGQNAAISIGVYSHLRIVGDPAT